MTMILGVFLFSVCFQAASALLIGNYPLSRVNATILPRETQLNLFARIFSRYDIVALPNMKDSTEMNMVMEVLKQHNSNYEFYLSTKVAKPTNRFVEHYGLIYRRDVVTVSDFVRDQPTGALSMRTKVSSTGQEFVLSIVHMGSSDIINEVERLPATYDRLQSFYNLESVLFVGDFNVFTLYMSRDQYQNLTVTKSPLYEWYIDWTDNTLAISFLQGAPARFLARGDIINWVEPGSATVYNTMEFFNLTEAEALGMAIFIPVQLALREPLLRS